jgi:hypothetical protein
MICTLGDESLEVIKSKRKKKTENYQAKLNKIRKLSRE